MPMAPRYTCSMQLSLVRIDPAYDRKPIIVARRPDFQYALGALKAYEQFEKFDLERRNLDIDNEGIQRSNDKFAIALLFP